MRSEVLREYDQFVVEKLLADSNFFSENGRNLPLRYIPQPPVTSFRRAATISALEILTLDMGELQPLQLP